MCLDSLTAIHSLLMVAFFGVAATNGSQEMEKLTHGSHKMENPIFKEDHTHLQLETLFVSTHSSTELALTISGAPSPPIIRGLFNRQL